MVITALFTFYGLFDKHLFDRNEWRMDNVEVQELRQELVPRS